MRVFEQNMDVPMPQILEEIVEIEEIVDIPVLQFEFIFRFFFRIQFVKQLFGSCFDEPLLTDLLVGPPTASPLCGNWCTVGVLAGTHQTGWHREQSANPFLLH